MGPWQQGVHPQLMKALFDLHSVCFHFVRALYIVLHVIILTANIDYNNQTGSMFSTLSKFAKHL